MKFCEEIVPVVFKSVAPRRIVSVSLRVSDLGLINFGQTEGVRFGDTEINSKEMCGIIQLTLQGISRRICNEFRKDFSGNWSYPKYSQENRKEKRER